MSLDGERHEPDSSKLPPLLYLVASAAMSHHPQSVGRLARRMRDGGLYVKVVKSDIDAIVGPGQKVTIGPKGRQVRVFRGGELLLVAWAESIPARNARIRRLLGLDDWPPA